MYYVITKLNENDEFHTIVGMYTDKDEANDHYNELQLETDSCDVLEPSQNIGF